MNPAPPLTRTRMPRLYYAARVRALDHRRRRALLHDYRLEASDVGFDAEVRLVGVTLGVKNVHLVGAARPDAEVRGLRVEVDGGGDRQVHAAQVEGQLSVDVDPKIVVATERELLPRDVAELHMAF